MALLLSYNFPEQVLVCAHMPLSAASINWYQVKVSDALQLK